MSIRVDASRGIALLVLLHDWCAADLINKMQRGITNRIARHSILAKWKIFLSPDPRGEFFGQK